jgi:uncharacterized protein
MRGTILTAALLVLSVAVAAPQATAQATPDTTVSPGAERAAGDLLQIMHFDQQWPAMISAQMDQEISNRPQLAPFRTTMLDFFAKYAGWPIVQPLMERIYAQEFTEAEIRDMIAFYRTPTGQKSAAKLPILQARGAAMGQQLVAAHKDELTAALTARAKQLQDSTTGTSTTGARPSP